jgi:type I restriction enzyme S subunit
MAAKLKWPTKRLGDLAEFRNGVNYNKSSFGEGVKVVGVSDFQDYTKPRYAELEQINPEGIVTERNILRDGDIVFVRSNGNREFIGRSLFIEQPPEEITHSAFTIRLRFTAREVHPKFYAYCFRTPLIRQALTAQGGGTNINNLNQDILNALEVPLPPLPVQRRIAGVLSAYDELMENSQRRIRILEAMARALYREWFVHFRFPGHDNSTGVPNWTAEGRPEGVSATDGANQKLPRVASPLGDIPQGWEVKPFTAIADVLSGGTPKTDVAEYWNGDIPFFTPRDVPDCFYVQNTDKQTNDLGLSKCASELYPPETVFITARGTVGKVALPSVPMAMNQSCYALRGKPGIPQRFLFLMTLQQVGYLKTNTGGATFDTIVVDTFRRMEVVEPAREIIARFAKQTDAIFEQVNTLQRQIQNLRRTRDLLLPRLLSGQIENLICPTE